MVNGMDMDFAGGTAFFPTTNITRYGSLRAQGRHLRLTFEMCACLGPQKHPPLRDTFPGGVCRSRSPCGQTWRCFVKSLRERFMVGA